MQAMPKLRTVKLVGDMNVHPLVREATTAPIFLKCTAQLPSRVRRLDLFAVKLEGDDGDVLANMLEAHSDDLVVVSLSEVTLDSLLAWKRVLEILHSIEIIRLELAWPQYVGPESEVFEYQLPMGPHTRLERKGMGIGNVDKGYVEATRAFVKPVLEIILQSVESLT